MPGTQRYSGAELEEFKALIEQKLEQARSTVQVARAALMLGSENDTADTDPGRWSLEEGRGTLELEEQAMLLARQEKYIADLERALERIRLGSYGICTVTGERIPRERLLVVPHCTMSMAAKSGMARV